MTRPVSVREPLLRRRSHVWLWVSLAILAGCGREDTSRRPFDAGRAALQRGRFDTAVQELEAYLAASPRGKLASRASFLIAKAELGRGDYPSARQRFERTIADYPQSEEAHKSRYKLAMLSFWEGDLEAAQQRFQRLADRPKGTLVPESIAMLKWIKESSPEPPPAGGS